MGKYFIHPLAIIVYTAVITKAIDSAWGIESLKWAWTHLIVELWPMWIGLAVGAIYAFVRFLIKVNRMADRALRLSAALVSRLGNDQDDLPK